MSFHYRDCVTVFLLVFDFHIMSEYDGILIKFCMSLICSAFPNLSLLAYGLAFFAFKHQSVTVFFLAFLVYIHLRNKAWATTSFFGGDERAIKTTRDELERENTYHIPEMC